MTFQEFEIEMREITMAFGDKNYAGPKLKAIWRHVSRLTVSQFRICVERLIEESIHAPTPAKFREFAQSETKMLDLAQRVDELRTSGMSCAYCNCSGRMLTEEREAKLYGDFKSTSVFRCNACSCADALNLPKHKWPEYTDAMSHKFVPIPVGSGSADQPVSLRPYMDLLATKMVTI